MCEVSDKIKFCTCKAKSTERLKNYWVFSRFVEEDDFLLNGLILQPPFVDERMVEMNTAALLKRLNEPDAFDIDLSPKDNDRLLIVLTCKEHFSGEAFHGFEYKEGKWVVCEYDTFEWDFKHREEKFGKVK